jgi:hypothetical protein
MIRTLMPLATVALVASLAACAASQPSAPAPLHAVPADSVFVSGTADCTFTPEGEGYLAECTLDMSDPRVSGSERQAGWRRVVIGSEQSPGTVWVADTLSITNAEGSWHGSAQSTDLSDSGTLLEAHYVGEGAYQGLEFHYYLADVSAGLEDADVPVVMHGWISGGG